MKPIHAFWYYRILQPMHFPIQGDAGGYLALWSLPDNLWVYDADRRFVRSAFFERGKLWTQLDNLEADGVIQSLFDDAMLSLRARPSLPESRRSYLRLLGKG